MRIIHRKELHHRQVGSKTKTVVSETRCRGCAYEGKSLRGHISKTTKGCIELYTAKELKWLEKQAKLKQKKQTAQWKKDNKEVANEHEQRRYQKTVAAKKRESSENTNANKLPKSEMEFKCNICEKNFITQYTLYRHVDEVHGDKALPCPQCPKVFKRNDNLRDHLHSLHGTFQEFAITECSQCEKKFTLKSNLDRHISEVHKNIETFSCSKCSSSFSRKENLDRHISVTHEKISNWKCHQC